jgi:four helix bundle protein
VATILRFEDLEVWQDARLLARNIFKVTSEPAFPGNFGFINQLNDAAGSIMDNIAEGFERGSRLEFINHLSFAKGSAGEVRSQLYRAFDRQYISQQKFDHLFETVTCVSKKLSNLIAYLNERNIKGLKFKKRV